jgi:platelet-activating factor acetylhydrolase IB subunit alpha
MSLTDREKEALNKAIYQYLTIKSYEKSAEAFLNECPDQVSKNEGQPMSDNLLEKKWVTIVKLNKRILELEMENNGLKDELKSVSKMKRTTANKEEIENLFPKAPAVHTFTGHKGMVNKVAIHPLYTQIASVGDDEAIRLWDFEAKKYEGSLKGHTERIIDISFDPNGTYLASGSNDLLVKVWDVDKKTCIKTFTGHDHSVSCVRWKNTSDFVLSASRDETIKLWELNTGFCVRTFRGHEGWVKMAVFNDNCTKFVSCSADTTLMLWDANKEAPQMTLYGHSHVVDCVMLVNHLDGKKAMNESKINSEGRAAIESNMTEIEKSKKRLQDAGKQEDLSPLEFIISGSRDKTVKIWSGQTGNVLLTIEGHSGWVKGLAMHHSNKYFYTCSDDKSIKVWNLHTGKLHSKIDDAHNNFVTDIVSHPVYLICVTSSFETLKVWECR